MYSTVPILLSIVLYLYQSTEINRAQSRPKKRNKVQILYVIIKVNFLSAVTTRPCFYHLMNNKLNGEIGIWPLGGTKPSSIVES
jgi:hypothetical protein